MSNELETLEKLAYENACCRCQYYDKKGCSLSYRSNERSCFWLDIEKELKAFEIIKKYPCCSLQRYIGFNELVKNGYELTQEHLFSHDIPCSVEEYNIVIEVLLNEIH